jgi:putative NADH-flavin reductase
MRINFPVDRSPVERRRNVGNQAGQQLDHEEVDLMQIVVVGATGRTGKLVIEQALAREHTIVALARRPEAAEVQDARLRVVRADVIDQDSLKGVFPECDAVISALGIGSSRKATEIYSTGVANVLAAVSEAGTTKLAVVSAYPVGAREDQLGLSNRIMNAVLWRIFGETYKDMRQMEQALGRSDKSWISLRPPRLIDKPATGSYRIGLKPPSKGRSLRTGDLAAALLDVLDRPDVFRTAQYVSN